VLTALAVVVLVPTIGMGSLTALAATSRWRDRQASANELRDSVDLQNLIDARIAETSEGIQSESLAQAVADGLSTVALSKMLGIDLVAGLKTSRDALDHNQALTHYPVLRADLAKLHSLRPGVDAGKVSFAQLDQVTTAFGGDLDATWQQLIVDLRKDVDLPGGGDSLIGDRLSTMELTFSLYTTALQEIRFASNLATNTDMSGAGATDDLRQLVEMEGRYSGYSATMSLGIGTLTAAAWSATQRDPAAQRFENVIQQSMAAGFAKVHAAYSTNMATFISAFKDSLTWSTDLAGVLRASSLDLRSVAVHNRDRAFRDFASEIGEALFIALLTLALTILLARAVVRPLRRLAEAAHAVSLGRFKLSPVPIRGPREVAATSTAINELTGTLTGLEAYTEALAEDPFSATLDRAVPGPVGEALQTTLDRLRENTRAIEQQRLELTEMATHDSLTGLLNRGAALDAIGRDLSRVGREPELSMAVFFIDLDGLKTINDRFGHEAGDVAIALLADALRSTTRDGDVVARIGGDEFLVATVGHHSSEDLSRLGERILAEVGRQKVLVGSDTWVPVRCSIGGARSEPDDTTESLINRADRALYLAKQQGGDQVAWGSGTTLRSS
jgi:diguanylate cyclase (GGDEF)-like protein